MNTQSLRTFPAYRMTWTPQRSGGFPLIATAQSEGEGATSKTLYVQIRAENTCPSNVTMDNVQVVQENTHQPQFIGYLDTVDSNQGDQHQYTVTAATGAQMEVVVGRRTLNNDDNNNGNYTTTELIRPALFLTSLVDYETQQFLHFTVTSSDGICSASTSFYVPVLNVNEAPEPPVLVPASPTVVENANTNSYVAEIGSKDPDSGNSVACAFDCRCPTLKPCLDPTNSACSAAASSGQCADTANGPTVDCRDQEKFRIDRTTLSVYNDHALDSFNYESTTSYALRVQCSDNDGLTSVTTTHTVAVSNVNERPTAVTNSFDVLENKAIGSSIGALVATDPDASDTLVYGGGDAVFSVSSNGAVVLRQALDYETNTFYALLINVTDNGTPPLTHTRTVSIHVIDVEEQPTVTDVTISVPEDVHIGAYIGTVQASSNDDRQPSVTYSLNHASTEAHDASKFTIDASSGDVHVAGALAHADNATHVLSVLAHAGLSAEFKVTLPIACTTASDCMYYYQLHVIFPIHVLLSIACTTTTDCMSRTYIHVHATCTATTTTCNTNGILRPHEMQKLIPLPLHAIPRSRYMFWMYRPPPPFPMSP